MRKHVLFILVNCCLTFSAFPSIIYVSENMMTIQSAVNSASFGDTIKVSEGTYTGFENRNIDFSGKQLLLISISGRENTIIDCQADSLNPARGFYFHSGEDAATVISGFTIINGYAPQDVVRSEQTDGGAILIENSSPTIENCIFMDNFAERGGAVSTFSSSSIISNCTFLQNRANFGGALLNHSSSTITINCSFISNTADGNGGAALTTQGMDSYEQCIFLFNTCADSGGAVNINSLSYVKIDSCYIGYNTALSGGGVSHINNGTISIIGSQIVHNMAASYGGGINISAETVFLENSTFSHNSALIGGGAFINQTDVYITNSIFSFAKDGGNLELSYDPDYPPLLQISCTNIIKETNNNPDSNWVNELLPFKNIDGNITVDPLYCDGKNGIFSLQENSLCLAESNSCNIQIGALGQSCFCCSISGDIDYSGNINITDLTFMVKYLFKSGQEPYCTGNGDIDQSGELNISDLTMFVNFFFKNGTSPVDCQ